MVPTVDPAPPRQRRRWARRIALGIVVLVVIGIAGILWHDRLVFPYEGPDEAVAPGEEVTIRDPDGECGPLLVSIWRPSVFGQWNQTHNGSAVYDSFRRDERSWWRLWGSETYATPVPCAFDGEMTFTLPDDLEPGTIAVCDSSRDCARLTIS